MKVRKSSRLVKEVWLNSAIMNSSMYTRVSSASSANSSSLGMRSKEPEYKSAYGVARIGIELAEVGDGVVGVGATGASVGGAVGSRFVRMILIVVTWFLESATYQLD